MAPLLLARHLPIRDGASFGCVAESGLLPWLTSSVSASRRCHLPLKGKASFVVAIQSPLRGDRRAAPVGLLRIPAQHTSPYAPAKNNPWAPQKRKSALSMPRGTTHALYARLCNTAYPACDGEPGGPGGPITLSSPPAREAEGRLRLSMRALTACTHALPQQGVGAEGCSLHFSPGRKVEPLKEPTSI